LESDRKQTNAEEEVIEIDKSEEVENTLAVDKAESSGSVENVTLDVPNNEDIEIVPTGHKIILEVEEESMGKAEPTEEIPLEIKNYTAENIAKEANKGEQLGLF
jgi:hypothetical protein